MCEVYGVCGAGNGRTARGCCVSFCAVSALKQAEFSDRSCTASCPSDFAADVPPTQTLGLMLPHLRTSVDRASNFTRDELPEVMSYLHERGLKGYVAFNVLVFDSELESVEEWGRVMACAGVDAVIVQV